MRGAMSLLSVLMCVQPVVSAHPGPMDACGGHTTTEHVDYGVQTDGEPIVPSEVGEYHIHFTPDEVADAAASLRDYKRTKREAGFIPINDRGTFVVSGRAYDILEYTRQGEAILHCRSDDDVTHTGIARMRVEP